MFKPLGKEVGESSVFQLWVSKWWTLSVKGGRRMKSKALIMTSAVPLWFVCEKCISLFLVSDIKKVGTESLCYCILGLSYILLFANLAGDAIHQIWTLASDVLAGVDSECSCTLQSVLQKSTKLALRVIAFSPQWFLKRKSWTAICGLVSPLWESNQWESYCWWWHISWKTVIVVCLVSLASSGKGATLLPDCNWF